MTKHIRYIAILAAALVGASALAYTTHTVKRGETIFGIAHKYKIDPEALVKCNPQAVDGVKKGMVLNIPESGDEIAPAKEAAPAVVTQEAPKQETKPEKSKPVVEQAQSAVENAIEEAPKAQLISYISKPGDTFASISEKTGVSEDTLIELNPFVDPIRIKPNTQIRLSDEAPLDIYTETYGTPQPAVAVEAPEAVEESEESEPTEDSEPSKESEPSDESEITDEEALSEEDLNRNIMLLLPFMAEKETPSKSSKQYADFYRGFLLAAKELNSTGPYDVEVLTLDTDDDLERIKNQLRNTEDRDLAVIIAPEDPVQLKAVIDYATPQGVYVLNIFDFKDETYKTNPYVIQGNIVQSLMYKKAIQALRSEFADYVPVILSPLNGKAEKEPFIEVLRAEYAADGLEVIDLPYEEGLEESDIAALDPEKKYVLVPKSGSLAVFNSFAPAITNYRAEGNNEERIGVFGYPDWTMYRNESLDLLHRLGAVIYSRFDNNVDREPINQLQADFVEWYGNPMIDAMPLQGALGYDIAGFLLSALQHGSLSNRLESDETYPGVQSTFDFTHADGAKGWVNEALYIITFMPSRNYSVKVL